MERQNRKATECVFPIFGLPLELREEIYYHVIAPGSGSSSNYINILDGLPDGYQLLRTLSRQIKVEAKPVLYSEFTFQGKKPEHSYHEAIDAVKCIIPQQIRDLIVSFSWADVSLFPHNIHLPSDNPENTVNLLSVFPSLQRVELSVYVNVETFDLTSGSGDETIKAVTYRLMKMFESLHGIKSQEIDIHLLCEWLDDEVEMQIKDSLVASLPNYEHEISKDGRLRYIKRWGSGEHHVQRERYLSNNDWDKFGKWERLHVA